MGLVRFSRFNSSSARALRKPQSFVLSCESGERLVDVVELEKFAKLYGRASEDFLP